VRTFIEGERRVATYTRMLRAAPLLIGVLLAGGCGSNAINHGDGGGGAGGSGGAGGTGGMGGSGQTGCEGQPAGCYTVYAHGDHVLYSIDLMAKTLVTIGPFKAPVVGSSEDVITDLAVGPDNTIYVISKKNLYTASATDGHVTLLGAVTTCGTDNVAMTTTPDGKLFVGDFQGAVCHVDITTTPPSVMQIGTVGGGLALSGDLVAVADGTVYATAYKLSDPANMGSNLNNILITLDTTSGAMKTQVGATGFPKLFGVAYALGQVFSFTHDGTGDVITVDPKTGKGTLFNSFTDPSTGKGISFAGAGVNPMVPGTIQ
jgi:hypothetical protein